MWCIEEEGTTCENQFCPFIWGISMFLLVCQRLRTISLIIGRKWMWTDWFFWEEERWRHSDAEGLFWLMCLFSFVLTFKCIIILKNKPEGRKIKMMNYQDQVDGSGKAGPDVKQHRNCISFHISSNVSSQMCLVAGGTVILVSLNRRDSPPDSIWLTV